MQEIIKVAFFATYMLIAPLLLVLEAPLKLFLDTFAQELLTGKILTLSMLAVCRLGKTLFWHSGVHKIL
jgi:hypothetical protein